MASEMCADRLTPLIYVKSKALQARSSCTGETSRGAGIPTLRTNKEHTGNKVVTWLRDSKRHENYNCFMYLVRDLRFERFGGGKRTRCADPTRDSFRTRTQLNIALASGMDIGTAKYRADLV